MVKRLLFAVASVSVALLAAPRSHADTTDQKFLAALEAQGIIDQASAGHAIEAAHYVCARLDTGETPLDVMHDVLASSGLTEFHTGFFVAQSIYSYCPRHQDEIPRGSAGPSNYPGALSFSSTTDKSPWRTASMIDALNAEHTRKTARLPGVTIF